MRSVPVFRLALLAGWTPRLPRMVVLRPHSAQGLHRRQVAQPPRRRALLQGVQQAPAVGSDLVSSAHPLGFALGQAVLLDPMGIARDPLGRRLRAQPLRRHFGQHIECMAQRLTHTLQPRERSHRRQHMRGVGPLLAPLLQPPMRSRLL